MPLSRGWKLVRGAVHVTVHHQHLLKKRAEEEEAENQARRSISFDNPSRIAAMAFLRQDKDVVDAINAWWQCALRSTLARDTDQDQVDEDPESLVPYILELPHDVYIEMLMRQYKLMISPARFAPFQATRCAEDDWRRDLQGADVMDVVRFGDALVELADLWVSSSAPADYAAFLWTFLGGIADRTVDDSTYLWKEEQDIVYDDKYESWTSFSAASRTTGDPDSFSSGGSFSRAACVAGVAANGEAPARPSFARSNTSSRRLMRQLTRGASTVRQLTRGASTVRQLTRGASASTARFFGLKREPTGDLRNSPLRQFAAGRIGRAMLLFHRRRRVGPHAKQQAAILTAPAAAEPKAVDPSARAAVMKRGQWTSGRTIWGSGRLAKGALNPPAGAAKTRKGESRATPAHVQRTPPQNAPQVAILQESALPAAHPTPHDLRRSDTRESWASDLDPFADLPDPEFDAAHVSDNVRDSFTNKS